MQTFAKHNQSPHSAIVVLERMNGFETIMILNDILKNFC